jgi:hypothetical protein
MDAATAQQTTGRTSLKRSMAAEYNDEAGLAGNTNQQVSTLRDQHDNQVSGLTG